MNIRFFMEILVNVTAIMYDLWSFQESNPYVPGVCELYDHWLVQWVAGRRPPGGGRQVPEWDLSGIRRGGKVNCLPQNEILPRCQNSINILSFLQYRHRRETSFYLQSILILMTTYFPYQLLLHIKNYLVNNVSCPTKYFRYII